MSINLLSGTTKWRNRRRPILWTGQNAQHLAERHGEDPERHPLLHVQAQQTLSRSELFQARNGSWLGIIERAKGTFIIPVVIHPQFVEIKTCYLMKSTNEKTAKQQKAVGAVAKSKSEFIPDSVKELREYGGFASNQETMVFVEQAIQHQRRAKQKSTSAHVRKLTT